MSGASETVVENAKSGICYIMYGWMVRVPLKHVRVSLFLLKTWSF